MRLLILYLQHPEKEVRKLVDFLGVNVTDTFVEEVIDKCSFQKLKQADTEKQFPEQVLAVVEMMNASRPEGKKFKVPNFYRKGKNFL